jgi:hypothetical protein
MNYWSALRMKKNMKNIFVWYYRSFETIDYMPSEAGASLDEASVFLESRHFRRRHNCGFKQDSRCAELECPASAADIRSLLRLVVYYRSFIKGFLKITKPMTELLGKY